MTDTIENVLALLEEAEEELLDGEYLITDDEMLVLIKKISELGSTMRHSTEGGTDALLEALNQIQTAYATVKKLKVVPKS
jgi:hypothetical protein